MHTQALVCYTCVHSSHSQLAGMLYNISYSILTASLGTKGLLLLNIFTFP